MYPFWCGCVPLPLSSAASWLLSSLLLCGRCRCVCFVLASPPFGGLLPPMLAGFSVVVFVSSGPSVAWILRLPLYIIALSFHLNCIGCIFSYSKFFCGVADSCHRPPLSVFPLLCLFMVLGCLIHVAFSLAVWGGPFSLCFVSAISPGGAVDPR